MATIAHITKHLIKQRYLIEDLISEGLINFNVLAEKFQSKIEYEMGQKVKLSTITMAIRRFSETAQKHEINKSNLLKDSELVMKSNLCDIVVHKSRALNEKLKKIYALANYSKGDTLNIIHGNYDVSIIINEKLQHQVLENLTGETIYNIENNLVALTVLYDRKMLDIPGIVHSLLKQLVVQNVSLVDIFSSLNEVTFIIPKESATKSYEALIGYLGSL